MSFFNERDVEISKLLEFLKQHSEKIKTILDVGCYGSQYLSQLKEYTSNVDGIDIFDGPKERAILRDYFVGNIREKVLRQYDLVICLSTLEHSGIEQYQVDDYISEQEKVFAKVVDTAEHFLFATFPYGQKMFLRGFYANIARDRLSIFLTYLPYFNVSLEFWYNENPLNPAGWVQITQDEADAVEYDSSKGVRCVCILKAVK